MEGDLIPQVNSTQMGLQVQCIYEDNETEYSKVEMSPNIHMVTILMFPEVIFSLWSQNTAKSYNSLLGGCKASKKYLPGNF